jgi:hypothetical protein
LNRIVSTKSNAVFLATVLIAGTIALSYPSFMVETAQAQLFYDGMDNNYNIYEPEYEMDNYKTLYGNDNYEAEYPSYEKDNNNYKSKDSSSVFLKKVKCNNINSNNNGLDVNVGVPNNEALVEAPEEDNEGQATTANGFGYGERNNNNGYKQNDKDFKFVCINNNNNINEQTNPPTDIEEKSNLVVIKVVTCQPDNNSFFELVCRGILQGELGSDPIQPNDFNIIVSGNNPNPSQFEGSSFPDLPVVVTLGSGNYQVSETADPSVSTTLMNLETILEVDISQDVIFSGDCNTVTGEGTIAEGEVQICNIQNAFTITDT